MSRDPERSLSQSFGGRLCLDFANTIDWRTSPQPQELLPDYATVLTWSALRHTLPRAALESLRALSVADPRTAAAVLADARQLREAIIEAAQALCAHTPVPLSGINQALQLLPPPPGLVYEAGYYVYELTGRTLDEPLRPVLWSLVALLASADAQRVGCCSAPECGWFFVDESPNRKRLWCSSKVCGNRERVRRAYAKRRSAAESLPESSRPRR